MKQWRLSGSVSFYMDDDFCGAWRYDSVTGRNKLINDFKNKIRNITKPHRYYYVISIDPESLVNKRNNKY